MKENDRLAGAIDGTSSRIWLGVRNRRELKESDRLFGAIDKSSCRTFHCFIERVPLKALKNGSVTRAYLALRQTRFDERDEQFGVHNRQWARR